MILGRRLLFAFFNNTLALQKINAHFVTFSLILIVIFTFKYFDNNLKWNGTINIKKSTKN